MIQLPVMISDPWLLVIIPFAIAVLIWVMFRDFVRFREEDKQEEYRKQKRGLRIFMLITRSIMFSLLIIALASPFTVKTITIPGDAAVKLLIDNSTSMQLFNLSEIAKLEAEIGREIPVTAKYITFGDESGIGDALLNNMQGNDNILIVTDGNNNKGRMLSDMIVFASTLNTTINAVRLKPAKSDAAVFIDGPSEVLVDSMAEFDAVVGQVGSLESYTLTVAVDGQEKLKKALDTGTVEPLSFNLAEGYHTIKAEIDLKDSFPQNNVYYKTVNVLPKPNVAFITHNSNAPMWTIVGRSYKGNIFEEVPPNLNDYHAIILDDMSFAELKDDVSAIENYVEAGNGLVVIGGKNSYDNGNYLASALEDILPVRVGYGELKGSSKLNVAVVIDISQSTGQSFGASSKVDVEKATALGVLNTLRKDDNVGVIAFNWDAYLISEMSPVSSKPFLNYTIMKLKDGGGTRIHTGLQMALSLLRGVDGSKNIVLISDGVHGDDSLDRQAVDLAKSISSAGIRIYTVGIGRDTDDVLMKEIASVGKGAYYEPGEYDRLEIVFGRARGNESRKNELVVTNPNHFITSRINLTGSISGYNFVLPKAASQLLVSTREGNPIITSWRYGLGRVVSLATDDGYKWSGDLVGRANSKIITRMINYAIGDPQRKKDFYVKVQDTNLGEEARVMVISKLPPSGSALNFTKTDTGTYSASFMPSAVGFENVLGAPLAVNYPKEYYPLGMSKSLNEVISVTGGSIFAPDEVSGIISKIRADSKREQIEPVYWRWLFAAAAIIVLLIEIAVRMIRTNISTR